MQIEVRRAVSATPEVRTLVNDLDAFLSQDYAPEQRHGLSLEALFQPRIRFFLAHQAGKAVGCGGVALFSDFAEVKRMYVREDSRGQGIADALLARLEAEALHAGLTLLKLETGVHQPAALRFYQRSGFSPCEIFEPYASMPPESVITSVFLDKRLSNEL